METRADFEMEAGTKLPLGLLLGMLLSKQFKDKTGFISGRDLVLILIHTVPSTDL